MAEKKITVGNREFTLFPCPKKGLSAIGKNFVEIGTGSQLGLEALIDGIYYGVKRGAMDDETVTREFFEWNVDTVNMASLVLDFVEVNKLTQATEAEASGEA